jgi:predicted ABC-type ATPase
MGAMLPDYLRDSLIRTNERLFSFETVFSHSSKVGFLENAKNHGWDVYLYFVSTNDPEILLSCEGWAQSNHFQV